MSVDCEAVSGYGIYIEKDELQKVFERVYGKEWFKYLEEEKHLLSCLSEFSYDFTNEKKNTICEQYGSNYEEDGIDFLLLAKDPINKMTEFLKDLKSIGINKSKKDVKFIKEELWC